MSEYRLHIDIPLGSSEQEAIQKTQKLMDWLFLSESSVSDMKNFDVSQINYRLGYDDDRQRSNYLMKNENGHVSNKKCKINYNNHNPE
jgi:hypothetical protein